MAAKSKGEGALHAGHRERLRSRFLENGLDTMENHVALELLLFYSIPRGDTNPVAHRLIEKFGSLSAALDAPYEELLETEGIGPSSALLLKLIPELCRRYQEDRVKGGTRVFSTEEAVKLIRPKFFGRKTEAVVLLLLDSRGKAVYCGIVNEGSVNAAPIYTNRLVRLATRYDAVTAILAHNHPSGQAVPTSGDISATRHVIWAMDAVDVQLHDHLIFTDGDYLSMAATGMLDELYQDHLHQKSSHLRPETGRMVGDVFPAMEEGEENGEEEKSPV